MFRNGHGEVNQQKNVRRSLQLHRIFVGLQWTQIGKTGSFVLLDNASGLSVHPTGKDDL